MEFRHDINGMRALAVIGVLFFHFMPASAPGGFVGVDVFFVISGFLMTSIIVGGIDRGSFTLLSFYMSRVNRILPALLALCLVLVALGWFFLPPREFAQLGLHAASSATFLSNFVYWMQADYFDAAAHEKWLLHTWSLSVEWHFYLLYPLLIMAVVKVAGRDRLLPALAILLAAGVVGSFVLAYAAPVTAFYLLPARVWELLTGAVICLAAPRLPGPWKRPVAYLGLAGVAACFWLMDGDTPWPGPMALLPVAATAAVIVAHAGNDAIFANRIVAWLGKISYSLYLWHWPVAVLGNYLQVSGEPWFVATGMAASIMLGALSFHLIEEKRAAYSTRPARWLGVARSPVVIATALIALVGGGVFVARGIPARAGTGFDSALALQVMPTRGNGYCYRTFNAGPVARVSDDAAGCKLGDRARPATGILFGDSYAATFEPFWDETGKDLGLALNSATTNWCFPAFSKNFIAEQAPDARRQCAINRDFVRREGHRYEFVVFAGNWSRVESDGLTGDVEAAARMMAQGGTRVLIMPSPTYYDTDVTRRFATAVFNDTGFDIARISRSKDAASAAANARLARFADAEPGVWFIDRAALTSTRETYRHGGFDVPLSLDGHHLSLGGSLDLARTGPASRCGKPETDTPACRAIREATAPDR